MEQLKNQQLQEPGIFADEGSAIQFTLVPEGTHPARCISVIDIGTQTHTGKFGTKTQRKIRVTWEVPEEIITIEGEPKPLTIGHTYTLSLGEKAKLRAHLVSWRGRSFTPEELKGFNVSKLLNVPCLLTVAHEKSESGKQYHFVSSISGLPKRMVVKEASVKPYWYSISMGKNELFKSLPEFIQKMCEACEEWNRAPANEPEMPDLEHPDEDTAVPF